jgi:drug/metabolite transporter (DMT)-like permease
MLQPLRRARFAAAFAAIYVLWGSTYLAVALGLQSLPPFLLMGSRSLIAGLILVGLWWLRTLDLPPAGAWLKAAIGGLLLFAGCHGALAYAQQRVPSGLAAVVLATIPFWIALLDFAVSGDDQRPRLASLLAMVPGLAGVGIIAWHGASQNDGPAVEPAMIVLLLASAISWAAGSVVSRRHAATGPVLALSGMQLISGGIALLAISALGGEFTAFSPAEVSWVSWMALAYLTFAGAVVAFTAYVWLLDHAPGPLVATYTFVNPAIAVVLGWAVLGERPGIWTVVGMSLVVGSVAAAWRLDSHAS